MDYMERVFLCDGDALIIPNQRLEEILKLINVNLPSVERIGTYANAKSILRKSVDELKKLKELGLKIIYLGVETGNVELLKKIHKGVTYEQMVEAAHRDKRSWYYPFPLQSFWDSAGLKKVSSMRSIPQKY